VIYFERAFGPQLTTLDGGYATFRRAHQPKPVDFRVRVPPAILAKMRERTEQGELRVAARLKRVDTVLVANKAVTAMSYFLSRKSIKSEYGVELDTLNKAQSVIRQILDKAVFAESVGGTFGDLIEELEGVRAYVGQPAKAYQNKRELSVLSLKLRKLSLLLQDALITSWVQTLRPAVLQHRLRQVRKGSRNG
jgi:hypothetical protein